MPRTRKSTFAALPGADLAYALQRLAEAGKTTTAEVVRLASERGTRIVALELELRTLRAGGLTGASGEKAAPGPGAKRQRLTPKQLAARKLQGKYMGLLRAYSGADARRIKALAKAKGVAAAVAEMARRRPGKNPAAKTKKVAAKRPAVAPSASRKPGPKRPAPARPAAKAKRG